MKEYITTSNPRHNIVSDDCSYFHFLVVSLKLELGKSWMTTRKIIAQFLPFPVYYWYHLSKPQSVWTLPLLLSCSSVYRPWFFSDGTIPLHLVEVLVLFVMARPLSLPRVLIMCADLRIFFVGHTDRSFTFCAGDIFSFFH